MKPGNRMTAITAAILLWSGGLAYSQSGVANLSGFVVDASSGESLIGAGVAVESEVAVTNNYGFFSIPVQEGRHVVSCSFLGYDDWKQEIVLTTDTTVVVKMAQNAVLKEALVTANRKERIGSVQLSNSDIRSIPAVFSEPDILKTLQLFPGVQSGMEGTAGVYVRGGGADENLFLLDGVPIYYASHLLGVFSSFIPEAVKNVSMYKGAFPARFGGRVSSIIDIRTNEGDLNSYHGSLGTGLLNSKLHFEGPVIRGKTSFSVSSRGLNTIFAAPFLAAGESKFNYYYYDVNGKLVHNFSPSSVLMFSVYHGRDRLAYISDEEIVESYYGRYISQETTDMYWGNTLASLKWNKVFGSGVFTSSSISWYAFDMASAAKELRTQNRVTTLDEALFSSTVKDAVFRSDLDYALTPTHKIMVGLSGTYHMFSPSVDRTVKVVDGVESKTRKPVPSFNGWEMAAYLEDDFRVWKWMRVDAGLRYTLMTVANNHYSSVQPRLSVDAFVWKGLSISASYAKMTQYVHLLSTTQLSLPTDLWVPITEKIPPVISDHYCLGVNWNLDGWEAGLDTYYKHSDNVIDYKSASTYFSGAESWDNMVEVGEARSRGLEFSLKKTSGSVKGWIAYTLSKSERRFPDGSINNGLWYPYQYDRTHNFVVNCTYTITDRVNMNATWTFVSGNRMTLPSRMGIYPDLNMPGGILPGGMYTTKNNYTLPPSHRLNVSFDFRKQLRNGERTWTVGVYNIYNAMNPNIVSEYVLLDEDGRPELGLRSVTLLPFLPSFSYTYSF